MNIGYNLVGSGFIGKIHVMGMNNFHMLNLPIESQIIREQLITRNPSEKFETVRALGFEEAVDIDSIKYNKDTEQLIDICNPNVYHKDLVLEALENDVHIYCEKPLSMNEEETKEIVEKHRESHSKIQLCYTMRYLPAFAKARAAIKNNAIGDITSFRIEYYHSSYLNPDKPYAWRLDKNMSGGGALYDLGSHAFDILQFLIEPVGQVLAYTDTFIKERNDSEGKSLPVTVDDWALVQLNTINNIKGTVEVSRIAAGDDGIRVKIYGTKGSLIVSVFDNPYDVKFYDFLGNNSHLDESYYENDSYYKHVMKFYPTPKLSQGFFMDSHIASLASFIYQVENDRVVELAPNLDQCQSIESILSACQRSVETKSIENITI